MDLFEKIMGDVIDKERKARNKGLQDVVKHIRLHPKTFLDLAHETMNKHFLWMNVDGSYELLGIPIYKTSTVDEYEIVI